MSGKGKPEQRAAESRSRPARKNLAVRDVLERFDSYYGKRGKICVIPDAIEPSVKAYQKQRQKRPLYLHSRGKESKEENTSSVSIGTREAKKTERKLKEPESFVLDEKKLKESLKTGQVQRENAKLVVIERIKVAFEEITGPDDPPVFLLHNQRLGQKRNEEIGVLVLHPSLGVLVLEVQESRSSKALAPSDAATSRLLYDQELIQEEMGDLLEKDAIVLTLALPNLHQIDADIIKEDAMRNHRMDHSKIFLLCGATAEVVTEWITLLKHSRANHAFRGSTYEERLESFKLACIRRFSIARLSPGQSVMNSANLHHRFLLTEEQLRVRDSPAELLHISGPPGSGKTLLLLERARRWLCEGRHVALAVGAPILELLLHHLAQCVCVENVDVARISTHRGYMSLLKWLNNMPTENPVSIIVDEACEIYFDVYAQLLDHVRAGRVSGLWTAHFQPLPKWQESTLHWYGGSVVQLRNCLRCPPHVIAWFNSLRNENCPPMLPPPVPVTRELGVEVKVISHVDHHYSQTWDTCPTCRTESTALFTSLGLLGQHVTSSLSLSDVVVITTDAFCDRDRVAEWLRNLGLRAVAEQQSWGLPDAKSSSSHQTEDQNLRSRICKGVDVTGRPVIHVVGHMSFQGLEKPVVLLWHEEKIEGDQNVRYLDVEARDMQEEKPWDYSRSQHQSSWYLAATRCQGRLIAMITTPSPVLSLLPPTNNRKRETESQSLEAGGESSMPRKSGGSGKQTTSGDTTLKAQKRETESQSPEAGGESSTPRKSGASGKQTTSGDTTLKAQWTPSNAEFYFFDKTYNKKGKVQVFPDILALKVTLFKKVKAERRPSTNEKGTSLRRSRKDRIMDTDSRETKPFGKQQEIQEEEKGLNEMHPRSLHDTGKSRAPSSEQQTEARAPSSGENVQTEERQEKSIKIREPCHYVLNKDKLENRNVKEQIRAEESEFLTLQQVKKALEGISEPDDPPVFILHNQNLSVTIEGKQRTKSEQDVLIIHSTLGILLLEVKAVRTSTSFSRFDIATEQLLRAKEFVLEEMGDLLGVGAIVLTIALPELQPGDSSDIRQRAQEQSRDARAGTSASADKTGKSGEPGQGNASKFKGTALLGDHPEIFLLCGSANDVFTEWVGRLKGQRLKSGHAFKGATEAERLDNFKRACIRRFSVSGLRPSESVRDSADLHHRFLLTEEQLQVRDSTAEFLHISGPPGSGKTLLLLERARRWLREGRHVALAVGLPIHKLLLHHLARATCGNKKDAARISVHRGYADLLSWLDRAKSPVSVIVDEASATIGDFHAQILGHVEAGRVLNLWTADIRRLPDKQEKALQALGGSTIELQLCLRCPPHIMAWTNSMKNTDFPPLIPFPVPITRELGVEVEVISHADHPQSQPWNVCSYCREGMSAFFSSLGLQGDDSTSALTLSDVVVITSVFSCEKEGVVRQLLDLGVRAVAEQTYELATSVLLPGDLPETHVDAEIQASRSRVCKGLDSTGRPVVHVVGCEDFRGLEKPVVILWHEDRNDEVRNDEVRNDLVRDVKVQKLWDYRLQRHRVSWFLAASRCQGRLLVVAATPSPLLSLLTPSTSPDLTSQLHYAKLSSEVQPHSRSSLSNPSEVREEDTQFPPSPFSAPLRAAPASESSSSVHLSPATLPSRPPSSISDLSEVKTSEAFPSSPAPSAAISSCTIPSSSASITNSVRSTRSFSAPSGTSFVRSIPSSSAPSGTSSVRSLLLSSAHSGDSSSHSITPFRSSPKAFSSRHLPHAGIRPSRSFPSSFAALQTMTSQSLRSFPSHGRARIPHPFQSSPAAFEGIPFDPFSPFSDQSGAIPSHYYPSSAAPPGAAGSNTFPTFPSQSRAMPPYVIPSFPASTFSPTSDSLSFPSSSRYELSVGSLDRAAPSRLAQSRSSTQPSQHTSTMFPH